MSPPVRVALLGFTPFEREHLEPALRALRRRKPAYAVRVDELPSCNLAVVDADQESAVMQVLRHNRLASTVMVGNTYRPGAAAQLARPIQAPALLKALDALVAAAPPMSAEIEKVHDALAALLERQAAPASAPPVLRKAAPGSAVGWPVIAGPTARPRQGRVLLVDPREASLRFLSHELDRCGLDLQRVTGGTEALQRLQQEAYSFVFLAAGGVDSAGNAAPGEAAGAEGSDGMDGFHTCRLLQRLPPARPAGPPPTLVLLLADDSPIGRLRAERAGADAWLAAPWTTEPLLKIIEERERWLQLNAQRG